MRTLCSLLILASLRAPMPALAQETTRLQAELTICARYEVHARYLADKLGEFPLFSGVVEEGISLQLFVNRNSGSWTALLVRADGVSCVTSVGENGRQEVGL